MAKENYTFDLHYEDKVSAPVTCLGREFDNNEDRRAYFTEELRKKLQDSEFRKMEGFPIGTDESILELSDPPFYTACPNPWIADFVTEWEARKPEKSADYHYHREPFAADVSEGKNDPIYNVHTYHTKVPHKAIMRYILHYTEPGDIVFDSFAGTGMTGVAAQMCGDRNAVTSLGYQVKPDGTILQEGQDEEGKKLWVPFSKLGARQAILNDLSPAATFIASNYNSPIDVVTYSQEANRILQEVNDEYGWMYETTHTDGAIGKINYTVWSDVFTCPECAHEVVFWDVAVKMGEGIVLSDFKCPNCQQWLSKSSSNQETESQKTHSERRPNSTKVERSWITQYDKVIDKTITYAKQIPVLISYQIGTKKYKKKPEPSDLKLISRIENMESLYWLPSNEIPKGDKTNDPFNVGITHVHHFYTKRNLYYLAALWNKLPKKLKWTATSFLSRNLTKANRFVVNSHNPNGRINGPLTGTFYIPSESVEQSVFSLFQEKILNIGWETHGNVINTSSATNLKHLANASLDYLFIDPPFGANIMYSELSFIWESWLSILTNKTDEAIENKSQCKSIDDYRKLMTESFSEAYRLLKPGRWMTVEFSNTKASVWNSIQTALSEVGFIVANVSILDKKHGGIKSMTNVTNVKQDLVISAYKPNGGFEDRFEKEAQTEDGVWDFIRTHLGYLPITKGSAGRLEMIPERDPRILFDQVVAYYVRKGYMVPISSPEFQIGLAQRFAERDGMYFLPEQVVEYDKKKMSAKELEQMSLFVSDESSAIAWLRQQIKLKPQTFQDLNPKFMQETTSGWNSNEKMFELSTLLEENFLMYEGKGKVPEQIHAYLSTNWKDMRNLDKEDPILMEKAKNRWYVPDPNKAGDLEKVREKSLLKEFETYKAEKKKLKLFRIEAVRAGFKKAWQERDYNTIIVIAEKIPTNVLEEDPKLLMWFDQSVTRIGD